GETRQVRREHTGGADIHGALSAIHRAHPRVDARDLALRPRIGDEQGAGERGEGEPEPERIASVVSGDAREGSDLRVSVDGGIEELARVGGGAAGARHHSVQGVEDGAGDHQPATESEAAHCKRRRRASGGHTPTRSFCLPKYLVSGKIATNATFRYLPVTINTIGSPTPRPPMESSAGSSLIASVASGPPSRFNASTAPSCSASHL